MPQTVAELLDAARALPESERVELIELIEATIPSPPSSLHPTWVVELRHRVAEIESGQVQAIPLTAVQLQIQAQLDASGSDNG